METKEKETELVQLIRQLKDYVILERKDYEKLVQNSSPEKFNESALEARDASIKLLEQQLARQEDWVNYWKNKYEYKGNIYNYVGVGKFKDSTGKWIDAIIYERDNHIYMREITDFIDKFKKA